MTDRELIRAEAVSVTFRSSGPIAWRRTEVRAVVDASFTISEREAFGLVGESGSGKTTLGRCVLGQQQPTSGRILLQDQEISGLDKQEFRETVQAVFQNPMTSLNPAMTVREILAEPIRRLKGLRDRREIEQLSHEVLDLVRLSRNIMDRRPRSLSGGMAQRVSIARALAPSPRLIVLDEAVSALDVATQAQIVNLLADLRDETGVSMLFVAHDLAITRHLCDRIAVMHLGRIVEEGTADEVCGNPQDDYTKRLLAAVPIPDPRRHGIRRRPQLNHLELG